MRISLVILLATLLTGMLPAQKLDTKALQQVFGRPGEEKDHVYKFTFVRTDLHERLHGIAVQPDLTLESWTGFTPQGNQTLMMGDMALLLREVNPVIAELRQGGIEVTALHNHMLGETPQVMFVHFMARGSATDLAQKVKAALVRSGIPIGPSPAKSTRPAPAFASAVDQILGHKGKWKSDVLAFDIPRADTVREDGHAVPPEMELGESIRLQSAGTNRVAAAGDFVLTAAEVNPVISALQTHHIQIEAIHNHMLDEQPRLFFLHFWGVGEPTAIAQGLQAALSHVHIR